MPEAGTGAPAAPAPLVVALLSFGNFTVGFAAFLPIGVATPLSRDLVLSPAETGWVMSVYALAYAILSPVLSASTGAWARDRALVLGLAIFSIGTAASAFSTDITSLLLARVVTAAGAGLFSPATAALVAATTPPAERGRALAAVLVGLTLAQAIGVPTGAWIGYTLGWRTAFVAATGLAVATTAAIRWLAPRGVRLQPVTLATLGRSLIDIPLMLRIGFTTTFIAAVYVVQTFLAPILEARLGVGRDGVSALLMMLGIGAVAGNVLGGRLVDRFGPNPTLALMCAAQVVAMPFVTLAPLSVAGAGALLFAWSLFGWGFYVAQQSRLLAFDPSRAAVILALNAAALYAGAAIGSSIGGAVFASHGLDALGLAGSMVAVLAGLHLWAGSGPARRERQVER